MGVFKLGRMTLGSLFKKPETVLYPLESKPQPAGLKGHVAIDAGSCILCGMCERSCATDCIGVDKAARTWSIDRFQCIQCGYCITVCPKKCLHMDPNYAPAATARTRDEVVVPEQEKQPKAETRQAEKQQADTQPKTQVQSDAKAQGAADEAQAALTDAAKKNTDAALMHAIALMESSKADKVRRALESRR